MSYELSVDLIEYTVDRKKDGEPIIHVFGRDKDGNAHQVDVRGLPTYFYIGTDPEYLNFTPQEREWILDVDSEPQKSIHGDDVWKMTVKNPFFVRRAREKFIHYEADVPFNERFAIDNNITSGIRVPSLRCWAHEVEAIEINTPMRVCTLDIEADDSDGFPTPKRSAILCITCHDSFTGIFDIMYLINEENPISDKDTLLAGWSENRNDIRLSVFHSEVEMLQYLTKYINQLDFDVLTGWNFVDFDLPYIMKRMNTLGLNPMDLGRLHGMFDEARVKLRGRSAFDLLGGYKKMQAESKPSFRLDAIAEEEVGEKKVHYQGTLTNLWREDPNRFIHYNWKDVDLCVQIDNKNHIVDFCRMLAQYVGCSIDKSLMNSKIVDMYLLKYTHGKFVLPSKAGFRPDHEKFKGATVMKPYSGLEEWVAVFDLTSLYPMIMKTINASPETKDPDGEYHAPNGVRFRAKPDGITRKIMTELFDERKRLKKLRDSHGEHDAEYKLYDLQQRVIKEIMNSYYGVSGFLKFRLYDRDFGDGITSVGRAIIEHTRKIAEENGFRVLYGDSVGADSKIIVYDNEGNLKNVSIEKLFINVDHKNKDGKEYSNISNLYTDTIDKNGKHKVVPIKYIMRHKTNKQMYRIWFSNMHYIDVTEDHSLFGYLTATKGFNLTPIERVIPVKPLDIGNNVKSIITRKYISTSDITKSCNYPVEVYELMGYFLGNGSFNNRYPEKNYYCYLGAGKDQEEIISKLLEPLKQLGYVHHYWRKKKGDIGFNGNIIKILTNTMRSNTPEKQTKIIPKLIYHETTENIAAFVRGLFSADGTVMIRNNNPIIRISLIHESIIREIQHLIYTLGISTSIFKDNTPNHYNGVMSGTHQIILNIKNTKDYKDKIGFILLRKQERIENVKISRTKKNINNFDFDITSVRKIEKIDYNDYVYDIEVDNEMHRFFANNILVHNTDSTLIKLKTDVKEDALTEGFELEKILNDSYDAFAYETLGVTEHEFNIKFEKLYKRFLQSGRKKRYAVHVIWKEGVDFDKIEIMGFEFKRSDTPAIVKKIQYEMLEKIIKGEPDENVKAYLKEMIKKYRKGEFSLDEIGIPGGLQKDLDKYENKDAQVRGALYANKYLGANFKNGSKPKRVYIKAVNHTYPRTDVICFEYGDEVPSVFIIDIDAMVEKTIKKPITRITEVFGWGWQEIDPTMTTLSAFGIT